MEKSSERRAPAIEPLEAGETVTLHNTYHETTANVRVNKNGVIAARAYRKLCRNLCEAELTRDQCQCEGPHGDPTFALVPLRHVGGCEWQICRRPSKRAPSRAGKVARGAAGFTFNQAAPWLLRMSLLLFAGLFVYAGFLLRWLLSVCVFGVKYSVAGGIIAFCVYVAVLATAMFD